MVMRSWLKVFFDDALRLAHGLKCQFLIGHTCLLSRRTSTGSETRCRISQSATGWTVLNRTRRSDFGPQRRKAQVGGGQISSRIWLRTGGPPSYAKISELNRKSPLPANPPKVATGAQSRPARFSR